MNLGTAIDRLWELDQQIDKLEAGIRKIKTRRSVEEGKVLTALKAAKLESGAGKKARARINKREFVSIKDRRAFDKFVLTEKALDLFQNRVSVEAWKLRREEGIKIPGTGIFEKLSVSITRR